MIRTNCFPPAGDGNLAILVSALAQPLRPWALMASGAGSGPAEELLPGQLLLRRASGAWVERLREGGERLGQLWGWVNLWQTSMESLVHLYKHPPEVGYQH